MCKMRTVIILFFSQIIATHLLSQTLPFPYNLDFEIGELGKLPKGWVLPSYAYKLGYAAYLTDEEPKSGKYCFELYRSGAYQEDIYGSVMQSIDARPYRGKTIIFKAYVRAEIHSPKGSAHIWVRERIGNDEESGFLEYLPLEPVVLRNWQLREIKTTISSDADVINFGLLLFGNGKAWIDSASFEIVSSETAPDLNFKIDKNLAVQLLDLAKVYSIVRYFSPFSEMSFNWECYLKKSINYLFVNESQNITEKIRYLFGDFLENRANDNKSLDTSGYVSWLHYGFPNDKEHPFVFSRKVNNLNPLRKYQGIVQQTLNVENLQGKDFVYKVHVKGKLLDLSSKVVLAARFDDANNKQIGYFFKEFKNIDENQWNFLELLGKVPDNAFFSKVALILVGEGDVYFDDAFFGVRGNNESNLLQNEGFENSKDSLLIFNWRLLDVSSKSGYYAFIRPKKGRADTKALHLYSDNDNKITLPTANETFKVNLSDGSTLEIPISVPFTELKDNLIDKGKYEDVGCEYNLNEISSQLAILIDIWSFLVHFSVYFDNDVNVDSLLLAKIIECIDLYNHTVVESSSNFLKIIEQLVSNASDNFVRIIHKNYIGESTFPFLWKYIDGNVYITKVGLEVDTIEAGDKVLAINSTPIEKFIDSVSNFVAHSSKVWKILKSLAYIRNFYSKDTMQLTIEKPNGKIVNKFLLKSIKSDELYEERPEKFQFLEERIAYFDLTRLVEKELKDILDTLNFDGYFIFDLRGIVLTSEQFLSLFTDKIIECSIWKLPVFAFPFRQKLSWQIIQLRINGKSLIKPKGVYFLVDERTIGIGEVIADVAKRHKIGILIGHNTGGNPMEFGSRIFPEGVTLYFSFLRAKSCVGEEIYQKGVVPNLPVKIKTDQKSLLRDQILDKVISLIKYNQ